MPTEFPAGNREAFTTGHMFDTGTGAWTPLPPEATTAWTTNGWEEMIDNRPTLVMTREAAEHLSAKVQRSDLEEKIRELEQRIEHLEKLISSALWKQITEEYEEGQEQA